MQGWNWTFASALAVMGCLWPSPAWAQDRVIFSRAGSTGEIGILLDGTVDGTPAVDRTFRTPPGGEILPGEVTAGSTNEIVAFQERKALQLVERVPWSAGMDTVEVEFQDDLVLDFQAWLLQGPIEERREQATLGCIRMAQIWADERAGISVSSFRMADHTRDPERAAFLDFDCDEARDLVNRIGHEPGRLNLYFVDRVDFGSGLVSSNGVYCPQERILVLGSAATDHLAVHEVGHALTLDHVDESPLIAEHFDFTNVMHSASPQRVFLSEGQTFRIHLTPTSAVNDPLDLRPGATVRDCFAFADSPDARCPAVQKRIWADGAFPPN